MIKVEDSDDDGDDDGDRDDGDNENSDNTVVMFEATAVMVFLVAWLRQYHTDTVWLSGGNMYEYEYVYSTSMVFIPLASSL